MKTIIHIVGNRPQFIKLAVLYAELSKSDKLTQKIVHTGQHSTQQMSGIFFKDLEIPAPDLVLQPSAIHSSDGFIGEAATSLFAYFSRQKDCIVFVYGDTNTTLAAAIAAKRAGLPLYHFEAGIRSGDASMPEEINRTLTDRLADVNYCCTERNFHTMRAEGYGTAINSRVVNTGDLMYDAFLQIRQAPENIIEQTSYVACTIHRAGNILSRENLTEIIDALNTIHERVPVFMPVHPHTQKRIEEFGLRPSFLLLPPVGYPEMKTFLLNATFVITDSGGTAREAFFCRKRSVVAMPFPFWPEIVNEGCSIAAGPNAVELVKAFEKLPTLDPDFQMPLFGNGDAAKSIKDDIEHHIA